jgi:stress-induced morphogen
LLKEIIMPMSADQITSLIRETFPEGDVILQDLAGDGDHYKAIITTPEFAGKSRVQQHQMVYAALRGKMGTELHALALETRIPETTTGN